MVSFESDYIQGAHPKILERLSETNLEPLSGYGSDRYCDSAKEKIKQTIGRDDLDVEFLTGGTQSNSVVISTLLKDYEGVVAATTGHISGHEAGAIEYSGHKVLHLPHENGRINAADLRQLLVDFYNDRNHEHMVAPGMVYISHPTEYGTLYSKSGLKDISDVCREYGVKLFLDGARLGYGLMSKDTDLTISDIADLCDVFTIGGTKVGALCGEAVVFKAGIRPDHFLSLIKQRGALLAKGRLLGVQFDTLFTDNLYFEISRNAIDKAEKLKEIFRNRGFAFFITSPTNQQFIILENTLMEILKDKVAFGFWEKYDDTHTVVRFATSWATTDADLEALASALNEDNES